MKKIFKSANKENVNIGALRRPLPHFTHHENQTITKRCSDQFKSYTKRSIVDLAACKKDFDLPLISKRHKNKSIRKKMATEGEPDELEDKKNSLHSIFKRQDNPSIDK